MRSNGPLTPSLFPRARTELFKTKSSSTIRAPPPRLSPQPMMPDTKWRRLRAAAALSRERARALPSSPVVSSMSQPQSSPSKFFVDRDPDSEVRLLYLFPRARTVTELFKDRVQLHHPHPASQTFSSTYDARYQVAQAKGCSSVVSGMCMGIASLFTCSIYIPGLGSI